jgi:heme exporter protein D
MEKLTEVLAMGGYGAYVWPCYAAAALVMGWLAFSSYRNMQRAKHRLAELERSQNP